MKKYTHTFAWGNNPKRTRLKGMKCAIISSGKMCSILIELESGEKIITDRRAIRKLEDETISS